MNMFNTDSGFRPPSPLGFAPPSHDLFGKPISFDDFNLSNQGFLNLPSSPSSNLVGDPSMQLLNPSEERYFSEFLDTLVVEQDFTFDPSSIPNLPNLPLFTPETMPGGFSLDSSYVFPSSSFTGNPTMINSNAMDFDMTSPSSQSSFSGSHSFPAHFNHRPESPASPDSPSSSIPYTQSNASASNKRRANRGDSRRASSFSQDSCKISTPIQQLSNLSLNGNSNSGNSTRPSNPKKNKRDEEEHPSASPPPTSISSPSRSRELEKVKVERHASVSDGSVSDAANGTTGAPAAATTKRKPYKELLTEEEKRANHIASEQKRRNTIRTGFKDMTEIIPDLKDINSSKSTILFKAVDFIKHLERQNSVLQEKANRLESRLMSQRSDGNLSGLEDTRLQDIPHIYPVPCNR